MHKEKNKFKRILWFVLTLLVLTLTGSTLYLQWYALEAGGNERGKNLETSYAFMYEHYPFLSHWVDSLQRENALRDTFILAEDGVRLHALYLYADTLTAHTAVAVHGYTDNAVRMLHIAYLYNHDLHYNVLLPDLRLPDKAKATTSKWDGKTVSTCYAGWKWPTNCLLRKVPRLAWWYTASPWERLRPYA